MRKKAGPFLSALLHLLADLSEMPEIDVSVCFLTAFLFCYQLHKTVSYS